MTASETRPVTAGPPGPGEPWTVLRMIRWAATYLGDKGVPDGRLDAELLLADALSLSRLDLYLQYDRPLTTEELASLKPRLLRRARREPLQYIVGWSGFRELRLRTDGRALIPRPETEVLVDVVLAWARRVDREGLTVLDLGTGTGAIALSLAVEGPFAGVVATDRSPAALELARENRDRVRPPIPVDLRVGDLFEAVGEEERFDVIVSNPPYLTSAELAGDVEPEIREFEPVGALLAGPTGLEIVEKILAGAPAHLNEGGLLAVEIGASQGLEVLGRLAERPELTGARIERDLSGRDRIALAVRLAEVAQRG